MLGPAARARPIGCTPHRSPTSIAARTRRTTLTRARSTRRMWATSSLALQEHGRGDRRLHRRDVSERRWADRVSAGVSGGGVSACPRRWRRVHCRRGADRTRSHGHELLGVRGSGRRAGHRRAGQAAREWPSDRRGHHDAGDRGRVRQRDGVLQHVWRQHGLVRHWSRGARCAARRGAADACAACR